MGRGLLILLILALAGTAKAGDRLVLSSEYYPPYNLRDEQGNPSGVYMDQMRIILHRTKTAYEAGVMPWARAIAQAENEPMHCVFAAARTPEREKRFKWVSPIHTDRNVLVARKGAGLDVKTIDAAKAYIIGTQRNDYTEALLHRLDFPRVDVSADFSNTLAKLLAGRIDMMPMSESALKLHGKDELEEVVTLSVQSLGLACNRTVPDILIARMQAVLDDLIADGTQRSIFERYGLVIRD